MHNQQTTPDKPTFGFGWQIGVGVLSRFILSTSRRFVYPFAPVFSRELGVSLESVSLLIAANQVTGLMSMLFGPLGDRKGYRVMLLLGLGLLAAGMFIGGFFACYSAVLPAMFIAGLAKCIFDPAILAYIGKQVPYHRRATAIGIIEMSWAGSSLIGIPLMGLLIEHLSWRAPFFVIGGLSLLCLASVAVVIPEDKNSSAPSGNLSDFIKAWRKLYRERAALGGMGFAFFVSAANDNLFVVYGAWLEKSFSLSIVALGMATTVIGVAELFGEGLTVYLSDRFGKRRCLTIGLILSALCYAILPLSGHNLTLALSALFAVFLTTEFAIVTSLSFFTEVLPGARATMISGYLTAAGLGRVFGALVGGFAWTAWGIWATGFVSAFITIVGLIFLLWGIKKK
ncbi:MAG: MFS transporter [Desulfobacteraceae bacterium]|nr:MFS transporter [Desulfobacteraceae bacterium]